MSHEIGRWRALSIAGFVLAVLAVAGYGTMRVASRQWRVQATFPVLVDFTTIGGLEAGQRVRVQG
ncbi:OmpA family protein, partial [Singulisphaera rosea]